jgi:hypothetical protein
VESLESRQLFATFTVNTLADSGAGSLREAINLANADSVADVINFSVAGTINVTGAALPNITNPVSINGTVTAGVPQVRVNAGDATTAALTGVNVIGNTSTIRGLSVTGFATGIAVNGSGNTVAGNWVGLAPDGTVVAGATGIFVTGSTTSSVVGGSVAADRNVVAFRGVAGTSGAGIRVAGLNVRVLGNYVGVKADGVTTSASAGYAGVYVNGGLDIDIGTTASNGNVIAGVAGRGVAVDTDAIVYMVGNRIGLTATAGALGNTGDGLYVDTADVQLNGLATVDTAPGADSIANNGGNGITVVGATSDVYYSRIRVYNNAGIAVDLNNDGVTLNDAGDPDVGPNTLRNFPVITDVRRLPTGQIRFRGTFTTDPQAATTVVQVEIYRTAAPDPSGYGEGTDFFISDPNRALTGGTTYNFQYTTSMPSSSNPARPFGLWYSPTAEISLSNGNGASLGTSEFGKAVREYRPGDMNMDGVVNNLDIAPFVQALTNPAGYFAAYPDASALTGDVNDDGQFNNVDIAPFVSLLTTTPAVTARPATSTIGTRAAARPLADGLLVAETKLGLSDDTGRGGRGVRAAVLP